MITDGVYWLILALGVPAYWSMPIALRGALLFLGSFLYLSTLALDSTLALFAFSLLFFGLYRLKQVRRSVNPALILAVALVLGYLAFFKYIPDFMAAFSQDQVASRIAIPLGISYFTFKLIHYGIETNRGNFPEHGIADFFSYMFFAPIFTAGPIERFEHFLGNRSQGWSAEFFVEGTTRIFHGLIKKLFLGDMVILTLMGEFPDARQIIADPGAIPAPQLWAVCILSFIYMYLDFSAYSDIAIGSSRLFGIRIMENFNWPILATNIGIFWKRWHMTLSSWCQYYVYMPVIGLTRNPYLAVFMTFSAIGLWHSGTIGWLLWGLYHATGISLYGAWGRYRRKRRWKGLDQPGLRWLGGVLTLLFVSAGSVFTLLDRSGSVADMFTVYACMLFNWVA